MKIPSVGTPIVWMPWPVAIVTRLNSESEACVRYRLPSMWRVGGMYLTGQSGKQLARELRLGPLAAAGR